MRKNWLEWTVFALSGALIAALVGTLLYSHVAGGRRPAALVIRVGDAVRQGATYAVPIDITNEGDTTAEDVRFEVVLSDGGTSERSEGGVAFVPHGSHRRAWVTFSRDPAGATLRPRVVAYQEP